MKPIIILLPFNYDEQGLCRRVTVLIGDGSGEIVRSGRMMTKNLSCVSDALNNEDAPYHHVWDLDDSDPTEEEEEIMRRACEKT